MIDLFREENMKRLQSKSTSDPLNNQIHNDLPKIIGILIYYLINWVPNQSASNFTKTRLMHIQSKKPRSPLLIQI